MHVNSCLLRQWITGATIIGVLIFLTLVSRAAGELPPPIPNDPSVDEVTCRQDLVNQRLALQDRDDLYRCKLDFARLEREHPLTVEWLSKITPADLMAKGITQEQVDQIYARLTAGLILDGPYQIQVFQLAGGVQFEDYAGIAGLKGVGLALLLKQPWLRQIFETLWQGKMFEKNNRIVRTKILFVSALSGPIGQVFGSELTPNTAKLLFPAKIYCGQSLLDGRRESIVLDYTFSDQIPGYRERIDKLLGPKYLQVRDELRMIRPGFYLGRVYIGRIFVFNFILLNPELADKTPAETAWNQQDCEVGWQWQTTHAK